ncbi:DUF4280 domain-containing protein [Arenibaculum pallidiluteum]|uniref:DUF4280 domain-containing protein n=1 Tax=Arenibaculum pallidiluteum TaxID=2812559 RepID=UPI001A9737CB|nr:DUF4280 domain-containing protein [Arenibaculum pallidiluteum]
MAQAVCAGAMMMCSFGMAPSTLAVLPANRVTAGGPPAANIMDNKPFVNVPPFGMCTSPANPQVASKIPVPPPGVIKPQPCTPTIPAPWVPGSPTVMVANMPALSSTSKLMCAYGGVIQIVLPGQFTTMVP